MTKLAAFDVETTQLLEKLAEQAATDDGLDWATASEDQRAEHRAAILAYALRFTWEESDRG